MIDLVDLMLGTQDYKDHHRCHRSKKKRRPLVNTDQETHSQTHSRIKKSPTQEKGAISNVFSKIEF